MERNGPITGYLVSYMGNELIREQQVTGLSFTAVGLQPRANYNFTVKGFVTNITEPNPSATIDAYTSVPQG